MNWTDLIDLKAIFIVALIFVPLERLFPHHDEQPTLRKHWLNDMMYLFLNGILIKIGLFVSVAAIMAAISMLVPAGVGEAVRSQPTWLQLIETIVLADIGFYLAHRAFHAFPVLWKFHSVHHSIEDMDWLAAHRVHPVDQILTKSASFLPIFALGFSPLTIGIYFVIYHWQALLIHSNVQINFGPLKWVLASPQFHHWHHANEVEAYDKNFAAQLPIIDALLGTLHMPDRMPEKYGTDDPVPVLYHQQLVYPFLPVEQVEDPLATPAFGDHTR